mmetsp:Transcript_40778/g.41641  ORF Transcript_40778/g.41641 Transcript_40778/m.41641 type:complete len:93 (+) Transcript_40778:338-616(+)
MKSAVRHVHQSRISYVPRENPDRDAALESIKRKLRGSHVKVDTIVQRCQEIDRNNDGIVHPDDFLDIVTEWYVSQIILLGVFGNPSSNLHRL